MRNIKRAYLILFFTFHFSLFAFYTYSNNINVSNVTTTGKNTTSHYTMVKFDINWDNSWRTSTLESNWDAAWVFIKWRLVSSNVWSHATLNLTGHTAPTGSTIDTPNDGKGVFMYKSANGIGSNNWINAQLRWNYGTDGVSDNDSIEVCLFAIEMAYVPQGAFYVGDGTVTNIAGQFQSGTTNTPFQITSESSITLGGSTAGNLRNNNAAGMWNADDFNNTTTQTLPAAFPKGYNPYYMMKYEITQEQYVEFLNKLTRTQQASRVRTTTVGNFMGDVTTYTTPQYRNGVKLMSDPGGLNPRVYGNDLNNNGTAGEAADGQNIACNWLNWADLAAYLDWSGLRPMTELEFEKACRGTITPVANECAWGNTTITGTTGISNSGLSNETASNAGANCASNGTLGSPLRVGSFAQTATTRQQSGGSYYGIMELSGNDWERAVTVGNVIGRTFTGNNGDGNLVATGNANVSNWAGTNSTGVGYKGGIWGNNIPSCLRVSDRGNISSSADSLRYGNGGGRGVRTIPVVLPCMADTWVAISTTNAPIGRAEHSSVWTGAEMIVWGGTTPFTNTGGKYNPVTDSWILTSTTNAPSSRYWNSAVWSGTEMIIWGGFNSGASFNDGGRYNPVTDIWTSITLTNAPVARWFHSAVWTGSQMVIWGGQGATSYFNDGGRYNPVTNTWTSTTLINAPTIRFVEATVWTGTEMIIWGGKTSYSVCLNTGGKYNPTTDTWVATSTTGAPSARYIPTAVWTGAEMIVWGGNDCTNFLNDGGKYNPATDSWLSITLTNAPSAREWHTAVWTNCNEMIIWGGWDGNTLFNSGGRYNPITDIWIATSLTNVPVARFCHTAVWTGTEMIIWGGSDGSPVRLNDGGKYTP